MHRRCLAWIGALLLASPAAGAEEAQWHRLRVGAQRRRYLLYAPRAAARPRPLVVMLHGHGDNVRRLRRRAGLDAAARAGDFLIAYPLGTGWAGLPPRGWNAGNCCGYARQRSIDDVAFLRAVVADASARQAIDPERVYAAGISNGAMMAHRLACEASDVFAAVASVAGTLGVAHCAPSAPVSILAIHGTADRLVPYAGGAPARPGLPPRVDWPVASVMQSWAARQGCGAPAASGTAAHRVLAFDGCAGRRQVHLHTLEGVGHVWPATEGFSATETMLTFFNLEPTAS